MSERESSQRERGMSEGPAERRPPRSKLEDWTDAACRELGLLDLEHGRATVDLVLDVARDVAHNVARPAAPLTAYLLGVAAGRSADPGAVTQLASRITRLALEWAPHAGSPPAGSGGAATTDSD
jgi:hypothetical protein